MKFTSKKAFESSYFSPNPRLIFVCLTVFLFPLLVSPEVQSRSHYNPDSPLTKEQQKSLRRAANYAKRGKGTRAVPVFERVLETCNDIPKCLALASYTEGYGHPLSEVKRRVMERAYKLCRTDNDYIQVALKARQVECYDVTRKAIQSLISNAKNPQMLMDLARKSQEVSMNDVSHLAMEKAYTLVRTVPEALNYARQVQLFGMDDLLRDVLKDLIDDENNADQLIVLLRSIEQFKSKEMNRYLLTKALGESKTSESYHAVWKAARRHGYHDIMKVAVYRAKKKNIIQSYKKRKAEQKKAGFRGQLEQWRQNQNRTDGIYNQPQQGSIGGF